MRIGVLTGGGDAPGLNAVIRAVIRKGIHDYGHSIVGFRDGWRGAMEGDCADLTIETTRGILPRGGTILGTSRTNPFKSDGGADLVMKSFAANNIDALIAIGGEDTLGVAALLGERGLKVVGVPKTIDNDLSGTDYTFGFDTAVQVATDAIDRLHTTAESHHRVMVVEVMGRNTGWIAAYAGIAGGADAILIPENPFDIEAVADRLKLRHSRGRTFSIVVVAEGATPMLSDTEAAKETDEFGHEQLGGIAPAIAQQLETLTGYETRVTILGHVQRGGTPTAFDRVLATRFGVEAIDAVHEGDFGVMVALQGAAMVRVDISTAVGEVKTLDPKIFEVAEVFFG